MYVCMYVYVLYVLIINPCKYIVELANEIPFTYSVIMYKQSRIT